MGGLLEREEEKMAAPQPRPSTWQQESGTDRFRPTG
jgi:hypothetical protein